MRRIEHQVAHEVVGEVDMRPRNVVVLGPGTIPKTPSGWLRRANSVSLVTWASSHRLCPAISTRRQAMRPSADLHRVGLADRERHAHI